MEDRVTAETQRHRNTSSKIENQFTAETQRHGDTSSEIEIQSSKIGNRQSPVGSRQSAIENRQAEVQNRKSPITNPPTPDLQSSIENRQSLVVVVKPHKNLYRICLEHFGRYDKNLLQQIQALNPRITDPRIIVPGQRIILPAPTLKPPGRVLNR